MNTHSCQITVLIIEYRLRTVFVGIMKQIDSGSPKESEIKSYQNTMQISYQTIEEHGNVSD